jgi:hypothetical protein
MKDTKARGGRHFWNAHLLDPLTSTRSGTSRQFQKLLSDLAEELTLPRELHLLVIGSEMAPQNNQPYHQRMQVGPSLYPLGLPSPPQTPSIHPGPRSKYMSPSHFHASTNPPFRTTHRPWRHPHPRPNSSSNTQPPSPNYRLPTRPPPTISPASTNPRLATLNPALKVPLLSIPTPVTCHQGSEENHLLPSTSRALEPSPARSVQGSNRDQECIPRSTFNLLASPALLLLQLPRLRAASDIWIVDGLRLAIGLLMCSQPSSA